MLLISAFVFIIFIIILFFCLLWFLIFRQNKINIELFICILSSYTPWVFLQKFKWLFSTYFAILDSISSLTQLVYESIKKVLVSKGFFFFLILLLRSRYILIRERLYLSYFYILQFVEILFVTTILWILKNI